MRYFRHMLVNTKYILTREVKQNLVYSEHNCRIRLLSKHKVNNWVRNVLKTNRRCDTDLYSLLKATRKM